MFWLLDVLVVGENTNNGGKRASSGMISWTNIFTVFNVLVVGENTNNGGKRRG
jgi:hypothetical protein